jgi:hypothetical protein
MPFASKQHYQAGLDKIVEELVKKSSGVFLWVILVVKLLLRSLDAADTVEELSQQLDALPTELGPFYKHMMDKMETSYRRQASWYLQMVLRSTEVQLEHPLDLMQCFLAEFYGEAEIFPDSDQDLKNPTSSFWTESSLLMEHRLASRCCGLVEALGHTDRHSYGTVAFIHKSIADFLRLPDIWEYIVDLTKDEKSEINFVLGRSRALYMRILWPEPMLMTPIKSGLMVNTGYCLKYLRDGESRAHRTTLRALEDLALFTASWARTGNSYLDWYKPVPSAVNRSSGLLIPPVSFDQLSNTQAELYIAACAGLQLHFKLFYAKRKFRSLKAGRSASEDDNQLLTILVEETSLKLAYEKDYLNEQLEIVRFLMQKRSDPNWKTANGASSWELLLRNFVLDDGSHAREADDPSIDEDDDLARIDDDVFLRNTKKLSAPAYVELISIFLSSGCQSREDWIFEPSTKTVVRPKELALAHIEQIIRRTSPADSQLYLKAIQTRKLLLESSEEKNIKPKVQEKGLFSKLFSRALRKAKDKKSLLRVEEEMSKTTT